MVNTGVSVLFGSGFAWYVVVTVTSDVSKADDVNSDDKCDAKGCFSSIDFENYSLLMDSLEDVLETI